MNQEKHEFMKNVLAGIGAFSIVAVLAMLVIGFGGNKAEDQSALLIKTKGSTKVAPKVSSDLADMSNSSSDFSPNGGYQGKCGSFVPLGPENVSFIICLDTITDNFDQFEFKADRTRSDNQNVWIGDMGPILLDDDGADRNPLRPFYAKAPLIYDPVIHPIKLKIYPPANHPGYIYENYNMKYECRKNGALAENESELGFPELIFSAVRKDEIYCTFTYTQKKASIKVIKDAQPDVSKAFNFKYWKDGKAQLPLFSLTDFGKKNLDGTPANTKVLTGLDNGIYKITETLDTNYNTSVSCKNSLNKIVATGKNSVDVNLTKPETITCTFCNPKKGQVCNQAKGSGEDL